MSDSTLAARAMAQHGLVTLDQAREQLTRAELDYRRQSGRLLVAHRGVYRFAGAPVTWHQQLLAACMAAEPAAVASHWAAASLWKMPGIASGPPEITVPSPRWVRLDGVVVHRSNRLDSAFIARRDGIPVTTPARSIFDLSAVAHPSLVERVLDDSLRRGLLTLDDALWCHRALTCRGRRKAAVMRALLEARMPEEELTDSRREAALVRLLVRGGLPAPICQYEVEAEGGPYHLDFAYPDDLVALEFDGWEWHSSRVAFDHDRARDNALAVLGWLILRFTSASTPDAILRRTAAALRLRRVEGTHDPARRGKIAG